MLTHEEFINKMLSNPEVKVEYDSLEEEFLLLDKSLKTRMNHKHTQSEVTSHIRTNTPVAVRLEPVVNT